MNRPNLLDSNICIYVLADAHGATAARLQDCAPGEAVASAISYAEVLRGLIGDPRGGIAAADRFFEIVPVLPFDRVAAAAYARLPFRRGQFDRLIAAHALALGLTLVTNNERDFADMPGLRVENWTLPL